MTTFQYAKLPKLALRFCANVIVRTTEKCDRIISKNLVNIEKGGCFMAEDIAKRNKRLQEWKKENREMIQFMFEKGTKARIEKACEVLGVSKSEFARQAINEKIDSIGGI